MTKVSVQGTGRAGKQLKRKAALAALASAFACGPALAAEAGDAAHRAAAGGSAEARDSAVAAQIEQLVAPYVQTNNFSGVILVAKDGRRLFSKAYGFADAGAHIPNTARTRFHIASLSMQYTAAAALRLIMAKRFSLDTPISRYVPGFPNARLITVRDLLTQKSGISDINDLQDYASLLRRHQTPQSLVERVRYLAPARLPGTYQREEHSAFNLLALIIEKETRLPFAQAVKRLVFDPLAMKDSGIDDDGAAARIHAAVGHAPSGVWHLERAESIHWSAKAGNASAYTTAEDHRRFVEAMVGSGFLSPDLRRTVFDLRELVGYGWFKAESKRFGQPAYSMNGRAPGFSSATIYLPRERLFLIALSNIYASFTPDIASASAAIVLGRPYEPLRLQTSTDPASLGGLPARFRFDGDFYQPNATVRLFSAANEVFLEWPSGDRSPLIPTSRDRYVDRAYGVAVQVIRGPDSMPISLKYDRFIGPKAKD